MSQMQKYLASGTASGKLVDVDTSATLQVYTDSLALFDNWQSHKCAKKGRTVPAAPNRQTFSSAFAVSSMPTGMLLPFQSEVLRMAV